MACCRSLLLKQFSIFSSNSNNRLNFSRILLTKSVSLQPAAKFIWNKTLMSGMQGTGDACGGGGGEGGGGGGQRTQRRTAGVIIIGDEVLKGQVADVNSYFLCNQLHSLGLKVAKVSIIGDQLDHIAHEVRHFSESFDFVITTGGIGPTHDDVTYAGVAQAFGEPLLRHEEMASLIERWLGPKGYSPSVTLRMADMPASAKLLLGEEERSFPVVQVHNVFVFPGIPQYLRKLFPRLRPFLQGTVRHGDVLYVARDELSVVTQLDAAVNKFRGRVDFGSYPVVGNLYYSTRLTLEADDAAQVADARAFLTDQLIDANAGLVTFDETPLTSAMEKVYGIVADEQHTLHAPLKTAVEKVEECLSRYELASICVCFNGGKDCTTLLHVLLAVLQKRGESEGVQIPTLCIRNRDPFPEMEDFIRETAQRYKLELRVYDGPIKEGLKAALVEHAGIRAVLMGTRRSDPTGQKLDYFQVTDASWPEVMRVSPLLDWSYAQVWQFLRLLSLPYCTLYDRGYTSIGSRSNTTPNEALAFLDDGGNKRFRPAHTLGDCADERRGRS